MHPAVRGQLFLGAAEGRLLQLPGRWPFSAPLSSLLFLQSPPEGFGGVCTNVLAEKVRGGARKLFSPVCSPSLDEGSAGCWTQVLLSLPAAAQPGLNAGTGSFGVMLRPEINSLLFLHLLALCFKRCKIKCAIALSACLAQKLNRDVPSELTLISVCLPSKAISPCSCGSQKLLRWR